MSISSLQQSATINSKLNIPEEKRLVDENMATSIHPPKQAQECEERFLVGFALYPSYHFQSLEFHGEYLQNV